MSDLKNYSIYDIAKNLILLADKAWKEGILAMEQVVDDNLMPTLLKNAILLVMDGTKSEIIISVINQYRNNQNLDREELVKSQIIRNGIEDILYHTSPNNTLLSIATNLSDEEMIELLTLLDQSELEHNLHCLSWYEELSDKNVKMDMRMQEILELDPDKLLELLIIMDAESIYFALKGSSIDIISAICKKTGDFVGRLLTKYLCGKEPEGVFREANYCQDKMAAVSAMLKEHALIQFPEMDENEKSDKIIGEFTHLQQTQKCSYYDDFIINILKMAAMYRLGYRHSYYQELWYRLGLEVMSGKGKKMDQFKEYLNVTVSERELQNVIAAGFELLLNQTYDINANAMMYAAMRIGNLEENIQYYKDLMMRKKYHVVIIQNDFKVLRRIEQPQTVNFMQDTITTIEILRILVGQKCEDVIGLVYLMGDERVKDMIEDYCEDNDIANIIQNALSNPLNDGRYMDTLDLLKYCSDALSKLQSVYHMNNDELELFVRAMDDVTLAIVLKMENGELKEKILKIRPSLNEELYLMRPVAVYSTECHNSLDEMLQVIEKIRSI